MVELVLVDLSVVELSVVELTDYPFAALRKLLDATKQAKEASSSGLPAVAAALAGIQNEKCQI